MDLYKNGWQQTWTPMPDVASNAVVASDSSLLVTLSPLSQAIPACTLFIYFFFIILDFAFNILDFWWRKRLFREPNRLFRYLFSPLNPPCLSFF